MIPLHQGMSEELVPVSQANYVNISLGLVLYSNLVDLLREGASLARTRYHHRQLCRTVR